MRYTEFSFLPVSKAIKTVGCKTDFGVSMAVAQVELWTLAWKRPTVIQDLQKKFISVAA